MPQALHPNKPLKTIQVALRTANGLTFLPTTASLGAGRCDPAQVFDGQLQHLSPPNEVR